MKYLLVLVLVAVVALASAKPADKKYSTRFDDTDVDAVLGNRRLVNNYSKCLTNKGSCTPDAQELKNLLPDALETDCSKCTKKQKDNGEKVLGHLIKNEPAIYKELEQLYDKTGIYKKKFCVIAKNENRDTLGQCD